MLMIKELRAEALVKALFPASAKTRRGWLLKNELTADVTGLFIPWPLIDYAHYIPDQGERGLNDIWEVDGIRTVSFAQDGVYRGWRPSLFVFERVSVLDGDTFAEPIGTFFTDVTYEILHSSLETHYIALTGKADEINQQATVVGESLSVVQDWMS